jgi:hypothetical protein
VFPAPVFGLEKDNKKLIEPGLRHLKQRILQIPDWSRIIFYAYLKTASVVRVYRYAIY